MNLIISIGDQHGIWLCVQWGRRMLCVGRYGDLCLWGAQHMQAKFVTGPPWPVSWALLT